MENNFSNAVAVSFIRKYAILLSILSTIAFVGTNADQEPIAADVNGCTISLVKGDITKQKVDIIVNAANSDLNHGGGVAREISKAAGPQLQEVCNCFIGETAVKSALPPGSCVMTRSYNLEETKGIKRIIHAIGPDCRIKKQEAKKKILLKRAYLSSLSIADTFGVTSIAFPAVSTKIFCYPIEEATKEAVETAIQFARKCNKNLKEIRFVLFDDNDFGVYKKILTKKMERLNKKLEQKQQKDTTAPTMSTAAQTE